MSKKEFEFLEELKPKRVHTETTLQLEASECGAASLKMILDYFGYYTSLEDLRYRCDVSRDGTNALNITKAAKELGLEAKGYTKELSDIGSVSLPAIIFWEFNHFVVLEGFDRKRVVINDPALGKREVSWEEFDGSFTGVVLVFQKSDGFKKVGKKTTIIDSIKSRISDSKNEILLFTLFGILGIFASIVTPLFAKVFIDEYIIEDQHNWARPLILLMILTAIFHISLTYIQRYYLVKFDLKLYTKESINFVSKTLTLPFRFFIQRDSGDIAQRFALAPELASTLSFSLITLITSIVSVVLFLGFMFLYSVEITLIILTLAVFIFYIDHNLSKKIGNISQKVAVNEGKYFSAAVSNLSYIESLKAMGRESRAFETLSGYQTKLTNSNQELELVSQSIININHIQNFIFISVLFYFGGLGIMEGTMSVGMLIAYQSFTHSFIASFESVVDIYKNIKDIKGDLSRVDDIHKQKSDRKINLLKEDEAYEKLNGDLEIDGVFFKHSPRGKNVLKNINLKVARGECVALKGRSGSGKSTLLKIISSLLEPDSGEVRFDGKSLEDIPKSTLDRSIGVVDQEIMIFEDSFRNNITLWDSSISDEDIFKATSDACLDGVVDSLPNSIDAILKQGGENLSGGEKQRIEIARALLRNPTILILDEATSALDEATEKQILHNIKERGCTVLVSAHRPSAYGVASRVLEIKDGELYA